MSSVPTDERTPDSIVAADAQMTMRTGIRRFLPRTLEGRTLLIIVVPVLFIQIVTAYLFFERHVASISRGLAYAVAGEVQVIIDELEHHPDGQAHIVAEASHSLEMTLDFQKGTKLGPAETPFWNPLVEPVLRTALRELVGRPFTLGAFNSDDWIDIRVQLDSGVLMVQLPQHRLFSYKAFQFIGWVIGASLLLTGIAVIFMRNQVRPIRRLAFAAESFGKGRDTVGLRPQGALEVRQAASAFIVMRDRIRRQIQQRTEMLAGVSHDLRTPLTRMKLQLAMLRESDGIEELRADVIEMEEMIEAYLAFARGEGNEPPQHVDFAQMIRDAIDGLPGRERIALSIDGPIQLAVRPVAMRRCLVNLIGNAARYAKNVEVTAVWRERAVVVVIDDDGPGISYERREDVFRPFVRLDPSRNTATGGVGLGLTIAREAARGHGGEINLEDSPMGGLRVVLTLPA